MTSGPPQDLGQCSVFYPPGIELSLRGSEHVRDITAEPDIHLVATLAGPRVSRQLGHRGPQGVDRVAGQARHRLDAVLAPDLQREAVGGLGRAEREGRGAGRAPLVVEDKVGKVAASAVGRDVSYRPQDRPQHGYRVRAEVPEAALFPAPRGIERA